MYRLAHALKALRGLTTVRRPLRLLDLAGADILGQASRCFVAHFDVERLPEHAYEFARAVREVGVIGTFYFQTRCAAYSPGVLHAIAELGHEVGYHYECLDRCRGDFARARGLFLEEVALFRRDGIELSTVCSHRELGIRRIGYRSNMDLLLRYPDLLTRAGLTGDSTLIAQKHPRTLAVDTFRQYRMLWSTIQRARNESSLLYVWMHPHRWHARVLSTIREITTDLRQYTRNWSRGTRTYHAVELPDSGCKAPPDGRTHSSLAVTPRSLA